MEIKPQGALRNRILYLLLAWIFFAAPLVQASGESGGNWIATWSASPQLQSPTN